MCTIIEVQVLMDREELFFEIYGSDIPDGFFYAVEYHDAEDAVQETYVRMLVKSQSLLMKNMERHGC